MPNELPLPPDMQHLIEKRSGEERRASSGEPDATDGHDAANAETPAADGSPERRKTDRRSED